LLCGVGPLPCASVAAGVVGTDVAAAVAVAGVSVVAVVVTVVVTAVVGTSSAVDGGSLAGIGATGASAGDGSTVGGATVTADVEETTGGADASDWAAQEMTVKATDDRFMSRASTDQRHLASSSLPHEEGFSVTTRQQAGPGRPGYVRGMSFASRTLCVVVVVVAAVAAGCPSEPVDGDGSEGEGEGNEGEGEGDPGEGEGEGEGEAVPGAVILAEIACAGTDRVELLNVGATSVDLAGWSITDDPADPTRAQALTGSVSGGDRVVVDITAFGIACDEQIALLENGALRDLTTLAVAAVGATWSRLPEPIAFASSFAEGLPTPGAPNVPFVLGDVRLNEVDCKGTDRVELLNVGSAAVDVGGFVLTTNSADPAARFALPPATIAPGGRLVLTEAVPPADGFPFDIACTGPLLLLDDAGATIDATTLGRVAEAFTWGRLPDGAGAFTANDETIGATNVAGALLAPEVFTASSLTNVVVDVALNDRAALAQVSANPVPCTFTFASDAPVPCTVQQTRSGRYALAFADAARFRGLEGLVVDASVEDPTHLRALVASRVYAAATVIGPRVGLARATIAGAAPVPATLIEVLDGRRLRRELPSTAHLYASGTGPLDLVAADVADWGVITGDPAVRDDLAQIAQTLAPLRTTPGMLDTAGAVLGISASLRLLAADAWLAHSDGYAAARGDVVVHVDADGEGRLLPGDTDALLQVDGPLFAGGSVVVDACLVDPACVELYTATLGDVADAADAAGLVAVVDAAAAVLRPVVADTGAYDAAVAALRTRLQTRGAEVASRLAAGP
jgi:hypothetical protein